MYQNLNVVAVENFILKPNDQTLDHLVQKFEKISLDDRIEIMNLLTTNDDIINPKDLTNYGLIMEEEVFSPYMKKLNHLLQLESMKHRFEVKKSDSLSFAPPTLLKALQSNSVLSAFFDTISGKNNSKIEDATHEENENLHHLLMQEIKPFFATQIGMTDLKTATTQEKEQYYLINYYADDFLEKYVDIKCKNQHLKEKTISLIQALEHLVEPIKLNPQMPQDAQEKIMSLCAKEVKKCADTVNFKNNDEIAFFVQYGAVFGDKKNNISFDMKKHFLTERCTDFLTNEFDLLYTYMGSARANRNAQWLVLQAVKNYGDLILSHELVKEKTMLERSLVQPHNEAGNLKITKTSKI